jgi:transposase
VETAAFLNLVVIQYMTTMVFVKKIKKKGKTYAIEVEGYRDKDGKVKHRYKRYLGTVDDKGNIIPSQIEINVDKVFHFGFPFVIAKSIEKLKIRDALNEYKEEIVAMTLMQIFDPTSISKMIKRMASVDSSLITLEFPINRKRIENSLDFLQENKEIIEEKLYENLRDLYGAETFFYDITSIALHGYRSALAKVGYPEFEPQINMGLCIEGKNGFPIFHEVFPGNIAHKKTLLQIKQRLQTFGRQTVILVVDAGIASNEKFLQDAAELGFDVIARIPMHEKTKELAIANVTKSFRNMIQLTSAKVYANEVQRENGKLLACLNERTRLAVKEKRYDEIMDALQRRRKGLHIKEGLKKYLVKEDNEWKINYQEVEEAEKYDGIYVLSCSRKDILNKKIVEVYFDKDRIEKCFSMMKGMLGVKPLRFQTDKRLRARIMLCYLAYLVATDIEVMLKDSGMKYTIDNVKDILSNVYNVHLYRGKKRLERSTSMNEQQKDIMKLFGLLS